VVSLSAQVTEPAAASEARLIATNPTYSAAINGHRSPEALLAEWDEKLDSAHRNLTPEFERLLLLPVMAASGPDNEIFAAKAALEAGANDKARLYAEEALQFPKDQPPFSHLGMAVFYCNLVLGRLALLDGDIPKAGQYLLLSGQTEGSPARDTFGPNMSLARELLKHSQKETVLQYLDECKAFWKEEDQNGKLAKWSAEIERDTMPAFGANLFH
jgi:hypothetical protein